MKKESNALYILRLTVTLLLICAAVALALAGVNSITKDRIAAIQAEKTQKAIAEVLKDGETAKPMAVPNIVQYETWQHWESMTKPDVDSVSEVNLTPHLFNSKAQRKEKHHPPQNKQTHSREVKDFLKSYG